MTQGLITENLYKDIAKKTDMNNVLKQLFSNLQSEADYAVLIEQIKQVRDCFSEKHDAMVQEVKRSDLRNLPMFIFKDKASSSGGTFLRWRSMDGTKSGSGAWMASLSHPAASEQVSQHFAAVEKDRLLLNLQMTILNSILRQLRDCAGKVKFVNDHAYPHSATSEK